MSKKKKIILFSIIGALGTIIAVIGIWLIIIFTTNKSPIKYQNEVLTENSELITIPTNTLTIDENTKETEMKKASPKDYSAKEVIGMTLWKISEEKVFEVTTTGTSNAMGLNVNISNSRKIINDEMMITCISAGGGLFSSLVSNGSQRYFKGNNVYLRKAIKVNDDATAEFSDDSEMEAINKDTYLTRYGWWPTQAFGYVIKDNTYLEAPLMVDNNDNTYTITIKLDPKSDAAFYYQREIATNANATEAPIFEYINITMTIYEDFRIKEVKFKESYKVKPGVFPIETQTETNLIDTYNYDNVSFNEDYYNYFKNHITN